MINVTDINVSRREFKSIAQGSTTMYVGPGSIGWRTKPDQVHFRIPGNGLDPLVKVECLKASESDGTVTYHLGHVLSIENYDDSDGTPQSEIFDAIGAYLTEKGFSGKITRSSDLVRTHGLDSLDIMEFTMVMEDKFGVEIPDVELEKATQEGYRIQTIIDLIESAQNE